MAGFGSCYVTDTYHRRTDALVWLAAGSVRVWSDSLVTDYIGTAEQRAEKVGAELVIPMVVFYFLPFLVTLLAVIGWPIVQNMGGM